MKKITFLCLLFLTVSISSQTYTYVPDDNFEQALIDLGYDNGVLDNYVPTANINSITSLNISNKNIFHLDGIEGFISLEILDVADNYLTSIDLSNNVSLTALNCHNNLINSVLNLSNNTLLSTLSCSENRIRYLSIRECTLLTTLNCSNNILRSLDVSYNSALIELYCYNNRLTTLDASQNTALTRLICNNNSLSRLNIKNGNNTAMLNVYFSSTGNPNLICIEVDNATWSTANWTNIDATTVFNDVSCDYTYVPDDNFEQALIDLGYDIALDNRVLTVNIQTITSLNVAHKNITSLVGIEDFTALTYLNCSNNSLTELNVSQNTDLVDLRCQINAITSIDVFQNTVLARFWSFQNQLIELDVTLNTALNDLYCQDNQLTSLDITQNNLLTNLSLRNNQVIDLDVSNNAILATLDCFNNQLVTLDTSQNTDLAYLVCANNLLTSLNVKNGNNTAISNSQFSATGNPNLTCIEVDDATWSTANWSFIDATAFFSNSCDQTYVPDDNFEQALIDLGYDTGALDDYVLTTNIQTATALNIANKSITSLVGIENFTALTDLRCQNNNLTTINITQNTALTRLWCLDNQLTSLDVSQNVLLDDFSCNNNLLTSLDVTNNTALTVFACRDNQITNLDVSNNTLLEFFSCHTNQLTSLDVSQNTELIRLWCYNNLLTDLNVKNGNNTNIAGTNFKAANNPNLTCIEVNDATWSSTNWTSIDATASFSENCSTASVTNFNLENAFSIYPNPAKNTFKIESSIPISKIVLFNHLGKKIVTFNSQESYNVSSLTDGIYFIQITSNNTTQLQKIIIK